MTFLVTANQSESKCDSWSDSGHTCGHKISLLAYVVTSLWIIGAKIMKAGIPEICDSIGPTAINPTDVINHRIYNYHWSVTE